MKSYLRWVFRTILILSALYALDWCFQGISAKSDLALFAGFLGVVTLAFLVPFLWSIISKIEKEKNDERRTESNTSSRSDSVSDTVVR
jgi:hypothetical protein